MIESDDIEKFSDAVERLTAAVAKLDDRSANVATNSVTIGDRGIMATMILAAALAGLNLALLVMLNAHDRKIDDLQHYLHAIYMVAPHLKPEEAPDENQ